MRRSLPLALAGLLIGSFASAEESTSKTPPPAGASAPAAPRAPVKKARKAKKAKKRDPKAPVASSPSFQILASGVSRVWIEVSEKVDVTEHKAEGRIAYRLKGVVVPTRTNRLPLETMFFQTPVGRVLLVELDDGDVDLVVELKQPSTPSYKLVETEGGVTLQVDFPASATSKQAPAEGATR
ncbi:hypothetical protein [Polyangium jinanense]|uniref:AMIN domain-containing protein n=1 Tax=Polyangium jinanense TaxID=2829994 RepID=A0A9X4AT71_9BACT|nr:hypothetical protein [Polyangium jinanense]MDC3961680.1 hypothetical protein [Polyangium jinanense]MDC3983933.1 hypothetical protein [Polyangium jinanense]MDC3987272.1 hypothetical protein [Polyangium jinanense]